MAPPKKGTRQYKTYLAKQRDRRRRPEAGGSQREPDIVPRTLGFLGFLGPLRHFGHIGLGMYRFFWDLSADIAFRLVFFGTSQLISLFGLLFFGTSQLISLFVLVLFGISRLILLIMLIIQRFISY